MKLKNLFKHTSQTAKNELLLMEKTVRTQLPKMAMLMYMVLSISTWYFYFIHNQILTYNDAASHLNIARRVVDNLTPGFAQIGTVWLPLPHILMLPFAWIDPLWHSGFAGSIVSMTAFLISILFMYRLILLLTESHFGAFIGTLVLALNPNFLYLQTTPMTEPVLIATFILSVYFMTKYIKENNVIDLVLGAAMVAFATLTRYDGWFLFLSLCFLLPLWKLIKEGRKQAEGSTILFMMAGGFGIFLWFIWNLAIFGDPLYFITGPYSAYAQQRILKHVGQLPTEGNLYLAFFYYIWSVIDNNGIVLVISSGVAMIIALIRKKNKNIILFAILVALSPVVFNIFALYMGQSAMNIPQAPHNPGMFNIRYGIMGLCAIALLLGIVAANKYLRFVVIIVLCVQSFLFYKQGLPISLADGLNGLHETYYTVESSTWLKNNYQSGFILTSLASNDAFVARAGLPMRLYIHEGTRQYWKNALKNPSRSAEYIATLSFPPDLVYKAIYKNPDFLKNYVLVHSFGTFEIYKRK